MTDKSPIQQAIELIQSFISDRAAPNDYEHGKQVAYENVVDNLKSLLPTEKEFAGKVWDTAADSFSKHVHPEGPCDFDGKKHSEDKQQFLNRYYKP